MRTKRSSQSRLSKKLEKQSKNTIIFSFLAIAIIIFLLVKFGVSFISNATFFLTGSKQDTTSPQSKTTYIAPPTLNPLADATSSATIKVSGSANPDQLVILYVNDEESDEISTKRDGSFVFSNVRIEKGRNTIFAKVKDGENESVPSEELIIYYKNEPPTLEVSSPSEGQSFSQDEKTTKVTGKTDPGIRVTVNDFWAISDDEGNFSYTLPLKDGENTIKVIATDDAGNTTEKELKVTYSP